MTLNFGPDRTDAAPRLEHIFRNRRIRLARLMGSGFPFLRE